MQRLPLVYVLAKNEPHFHNDLEIKNNQNKVVLQNLEVLLMLLFLNKNLKKYHLVDDSINILLMGLK